MDTKTLSELAFFRIRSTIAEFCISTEGKTELEQREPYTETEKIEELKTLSREWDGYIRSTRANALLSWPSVQPFLKLMRTEGAVLDQDQIFALAQFCRSALHVSESVSSAAQSLPLEHLASRCTLIPLADIEQAAEMIDRVIDANGMLRDLKVLREIRAHIAALHSEIASILHKYTSDPKLSGVLESNVPAYRADRQVLAVRTSHRTSISGIVHEMSQSGQTLYIEPDEVVRKNNELVQEEFHLQQEIRRVFADLTAELRIFEPSFETALSVMVTLDTTLAAARWGKETDSVYALPCDGIAPLLIRARHPLLGSHAVPIDVRFLEGRRVLIITGPNTGGKTVTIKTFALCSLLNQAGFPVPAAEGTRLPVFNAVYADIGDEQSIDQSLSTFSAHMKNIASAVDHAGADSLVLLDELGSGTDPQEGGAIAMAVLDTLIEKKAFVLVTTHHGILKNYGYTNKACVNASVDFDRTTLAPTYRILMGVPGESHALDIAQRSGLPEKVVTQAKSYLTNEQADISTLIKGLTAKHAELAELQKQAEIQKHDLEEKQRRINLQELHLRQRELELKTQEHRTSSSFLTETRKNLENLVRKLREGEITREKTLSVKRFISDLDRDVQEMGKTLETEESRLAQDTAAFESAEEVRTENGMRITTDERKHSLSKKKKTNQRKLKTSEAFALAKSPYSDAAAAKQPVHTKQTGAGQKNSGPLLYPGAEVFAGPSRSRGTLVRLEKKGMWCVQLGSIRMSIREKDIVAAPPAAPARSTADVTIELAGSPDTENALFGKSGSATDKPVFELRLLGLRYEEAIKALERQLDLCSIHNFRNFSVIHGKGTGVLQQAVQDCLSHYPGVQEFHFAQPEDGGTGKTYVTLR